MVGAGDPALSAFYRWEVEDVEGQQYYMDVVENNDGLGGDYDEGRGLVHDEFRAQKRRDRERRIKDLDRYICLTFEYVTRDKNNKCLNLRDEEGDDIREWFQILVDGYDVEEVNDFH